MDSSTLHRKLLYCGYSDVADHLKNSPINRYIYKLLIDLLPAYQIAVPVVNIFNEVYYQCVRIQSEGNPTEEISRRYIDEEEVWLGSDSGNTNMLVFSIVWALFKRKRKLQLNEASFLTLLTPLVNESEFVSVGQVMVKYMEDNNIHTPNKFKFMPCPIEDIPMRIDLEYHTTMTKMEKLKNALSLPVESSDVDFNPWRKVTDGFSKQEILWYVYLYSNREDQLRLVERIKRACTKNELHNLCDFFDWLVDNIRNGDYVVNSTPFMHISRDYIRSMGWHYDSYEMDAKMFDKVRGNYERQIKELDEKHQLDLNRMKSKYQAEIDELKQRLERNPTKEQMTANKSEVMDELTLTLNEMAAFMKNRFTKSGADEVCAMLYRKAIEHGCTSEETFKTIDSIVTNILQRDATHQTINIPSATQVNIGPKEVNNYTNEE